MHDSDDGYDAWLNLDADVYDLAITRPIESSGDNEVPDDTD